MFESFDASQLNLWAGEIKPEAMKSADTQTLMGTTDLDTQMDSPSEGNEATTLPTKTSDINFDEQILSRVEPAWNESSDAELELNRDESQPSSRGRIMLPIMTQI